MGAVFLVFFSMCFVSVVVSLNMGENCEIPIKILLQKKGTNSFHVLSKELKLAFLHGTLHFYFSNTFFLHYLNQIEQVSLFI